MHLQRAQPGTPQAMGATNLLLQDLAKFCTTKKLLLRVSPAAVLFCESATANEKVGRPSHDVNSSIYNCCFAVSQWTAQQKIKNKPGKLKSANGLPPKINTYARKAVEAQTHTQFRHFKLWQRECGTKKSIPFLPSCLSHTE